MQINLPAPELSLPDQFGRPRWLAACRGRIAVVNFWSAECPWSERADRHLLEVASQHPGQVVYLPVASNFNETSELITRAIQYRGLDFVLIDENARLADAWGAQTTPHAFVIDAAGSLRYQGAVDDVTFRKRVPEQFYVQEAIEALLAGHLPDIQETRPYGCAIVRP